MGADAGESLRILVACGAGGGIAATFNAPITGVFFGVELILREFSIEAIFTVMLSAMVADGISQAFLGNAPFFTGFPSGIAVHDASDYLLIAGLAVIAALLGLAFKTVLYWVEDLCDRLWHGRPELLRPAVGGVALGLLLLAIPQMYGVGYPVMYNAVGGHYVLWFLVILVLAKMLACSLTIGIGGSGGIFAPSLFIGATCWDGLRRGREPSVWDECGPAGPLRRRRHGRGLHGRGTSTPDVVGQRGGNDR